MKEIQEKLLKPIIIIAVIIVLTLADFIVVGLEFMSYAIDGIETTNEANVLFTAVFLDNNGNESRILEKNMGENIAKLRLAIQIEKEGYFNGEIQIENNNFKLKNNIENQYINSISDNCIKLNQVGAGERIILDIDIEDIKDDQYLLENLNRTSQIRLLGTYVKGNNKNVNINATREVQLKLNSNSNIQGKANIVTNKVYELNGENKRVVQFEVETKVSENSYPIKTTKIEAEVLEGTERIEVSKRGTYATNNNRRDIDSNWDKDNNKVKIEISNIEENGYIQWNKEDSDKILVTYILPEDSNIQDKSVSTNCQIELYDGNNSILESKVDATISEEKDGAIVYERLLPESIYKGNLYYGEETKITTNTVIDVRLKNIANTISDEEGNALYTAQNRTYNANLKYISTKFNKEQAIKLLGNTGKIQITSEDGTTIAELIKENIEKEPNDTIEINYEGKNNIKIKILNAEGEGRLVFEHTQILQEEVGIKETAKSFTNVKVNDLLSADKNISSISVEKTVELKEPETFATLTSNVDTLSTLQTNEDVEFNVILKTDNAKYELYKNPVIDIELPEGITNITADLSAVFLDELQLKATNIYNTESGNKAMRIELEGEQVKHSNNVSEGIVLNIKANIDVAKLTSTKDTEIKMTYTNENTKGNVYESKLPIKIKSKDGLLVYNKIENYDSTGEVFETEESRTFSKIIDTSNQGKQVNANTVLVNNYPESIENVTIIGKNEDNTTMDLDILKSIEVSNDAQIYYSEDEENWTQDINQIENVKAYKIEKPQITTSEAMLLNYEFKLPEELIYNQVGKITQNVSYSYQGQELDHNFNVELQTENIPIESENKPTETHTDEVTGELEVNTTTKLGTRDINENDTVYEGETLKNIITISNKTGKDLTNVKVKVKQENAKIYDLKEKEVFNYEISNEVMIEHAYEELDTNEKEFKTINTIRNGEVIQLSYETVIQQVEGTDKTTYGAIEILADDINKVEKRTIENKIEQGEIKINSKFALNEEVELYSNYVAKTIATIENTANRDLENVAVIIQLSGLYIKNEKSIDFYDNSLEDIDTIQNIKYDNNNKTITFTITKLPKGEKIQAILKTIVGKIPLDKNKETIGIVTTAMTEENKTYSSNVALREITQSDVNITVKQESDVPDGRILKNEDKFNIKIILSNNTDNEREYSLEDSLDPVFKINDVRLKTRDGEKKIDKQYYEEGKLTYKDKISANEKIEFLVNITVDINDINYTEVSNVAKLYFINSQYAPIETNELTFELEEHKEPNIDDDDDDNDNDDDKDNSGDNNNDSNNPKVEKHEISGTAWLDKNRNGKIDVDETNLAGIQVKLVNKNTGEFLQDTTTNKNGDYKFVVSNGEYMVVFLYDTQKYNVTEYKKSGVSKQEDSDVISKNINLNNVETLVGITDTIKIINKNIDDISIGLVEKQIFDLKLDKSVSKIVIQNNQGTTVREYNNEKLAKVEIKSKYYKGSTVVIEYKIAITNEGEIEGYANDVIDYLPPELKFSSELNKDWYIANDKNLHNTSLANQKIKAGETKELSLILTKTLNENEGGLISNISEIYQSSNNQNIADRDSKAGNKANGEDDISKADVIITVGTGATKICIIGIFITLIIIGIIIFIMKRKEGKMIEKDNQ